jgi:serine/threonine protein kinase
MMQRNTRSIGGVYQVGQMITSGPFLQTYTAYNRNTNDVVGLLVIALPPAFDIHTAERLLTPLGNRRLIQSPHVIRLHDWGVSEDKIYIATDPPRGVTLRQLADTENLNLIRSLDLAKQMVNGVAALQATNIVDTDLRPQLITVDTIGQDDRVQLDDVGLRSLFRQLGYMQGQNSRDIEYLDPRYMAPESIYRGVIGSTSDVYQLGILLFELVAGRPPFVGRTPAETGIMQSNSPVPPMNQFQHDTPPALQAIIERALSKNPEYRYPHATALLAALESVTLPKYALAGEGVITQPPPARASGLTNEMVLPTTNTSIDKLDTVIEGGKTERRPRENVALPATEDQIYAYLDFTGDDGVTQRLPMKEKYVIVGRLDPKRGIRPEIDLTAFDAQATVSRQHARIRFEKTFFYIEDLKSRNKTRLGELMLTALKAELLQPGDILHFGSVRLVFRVPGLQDVRVPQNLP